MSMKGHIRERSPGRWAIVIDLRDPATGSRRRKWHSFAGTKRQAQVECSRLISAISGGAYLEPAKVTVAAQWSVGLNMCGHKFRPRRLSGIAAWCTATSCRYWGQ